MVEPGLVHLADVEPLWRRPGRADRARVRAADVLRRTLVPRRPHECDPSPGSATSGVTGAGTPLADRRNGPSPGRKRHSRAGAHARGPGPWVSYARSRRGRRWERISDQTAVRLDG